MPDLSKWGEYLTNPYALVGFLVMLFFAFVVAFAKKKGRISDFNFIVVLLLSVIVVIFVVSRLFPEGGNGPQKTPIETSDDAIVSPEVDGVSIIVNTSGDKSPAIISNGNVNVNFNE